MSLPRPVVIMGQLWLLIAIGRSAAMPTEDATMVVTKYEQTTDTELSDSSTTPTPDIDPTTEEHIPPIKMTEMNVKSVISMRYAHTSVVTHVRNPAKRAQEAHFRVLLPETAFISGFVMTIDGKSYKAYVKEKEEAKQIYQDAVSQGFGAAHVAAKARDSNHFTTTFNVEAASKVIFNLTYEEMLVRRNDVYQHVVNLHPGSLVPKFTVTVHIKETANISELRVPEIRTGNEVDATKDDAQMSNVIIQREGTSAVITFSPDLEEQKRLMHVYAEKSKESATGENAGEGVLGQFVVQYDVDRPKDGQILVNDGYFVHFFAPDLPPLNKYVVFVLDTSGSMSGRKMEQLKEAMYTILNELNPGDYFSIIDFESIITVHELSEADKEKTRYKYFYYNEIQPKLDLVAPYQATPENIEKAKIIISRLESIGGTDINTALTVAVDLINKYAGGNARQDVNSSSTTTLPTPTSEETTTEKESLDEVKEKVKTLEPIIIFLTDGDPTVGVTNTKTIIKHLTEKNKGENKATMFCLGLGDDVNNKFLRKLCLLNDGFSRRIYEAADAALQLSDFYRQVSSPLLAHVNFVYPSDQVNEETTTKHKFRTFYAGSELVVAGRTINNPTELDTQVLGFCGVLDDGYTRRHFDKKLKVPVPVEKHENFPLERLWAYLTIKQLLDEKDASDIPDEDKNKENNPEKKALTLALKYEFVTPLTSLVVVKPNETNAVNAESVDKPAFQESSFASVPVYDISNVRPGTVALQSLPSPQLTADTSYQYQPLSIPAYNRFGGDPSYSTNSVSGSSAGLMSLKGGYTAQHFSMARPQLASFSSYADVSDRVEFESYDDDGHIYLKSIQRRPVPPVKWPSSTPLTTPVVLIPGLYTYHLEDYSWTESLLNFTSDSIVLQANETVTMILTQEIQAPHAPAGDANCTNAIAGGDGKCVYLTRCYEARNITVDLYKTTYCIVDGGYAGVCCDKAKVDAIIIT